MAGIRLGLCALVLGVAAPASADFSWEISGAVVDAERDRQSDSEDTELAATHYFAAVDDGGVPYALAVFFDPVTRISAAVSENEQRVRPTLPPGLSVPVPELELVARDYSIGGQYVFRGSRWYVGGRYASGDFERPPSGVLSADNTSQGVLAGKYFGMNRTRLEVSLDRSKAETEQLSLFCQATAFCVTGSNTTTEATTDAARVGVTHVRRFRAATYRLFGNISESRVRLISRSPAFTLPPAQTIPGIATDVELDPTRAYSVGAELFPLAKIGARIGYSRLDVPGSDQEAVDIGASWFIRRNVGLELSVGRDEPEDDAPRAERAALRVVGRL
jgi:hypothetical protein